jgi:hypothetical protein
LAAYIKLDGSIPFDVKFWPASGEKQAFGVFSVNVENAGSKRKDTFSVNARGDLALLVSTLKKGSYVEVEGVPEMSTPKEGATDKTKYLNIVATSIVPKETPVSAVQISDPTVDDEPDPFA